VRQKGSQKIDVSGQTSNLLNSAFSGLNINGLPEGPAIPLPENRTSEPAQPAKRGRVVLRRETAQRGGKVVVVISEFEPQIPTHEIEELGRALKKHCGSGGCVKGREVEIQGEQADRIREYLTKQGFRVVGLR
jgi:translation initiation factor 1